MSHNAVNTNNKKSLSIIVPAYNEHEVLSSFHHRTVAVIDKIGVDAEFIYVNDGSDDETLADMEALKRLDSRVAIVDLSRNFGKEIAMTAGLDHSNGDAVIVIDADLQDPPELIPELYQYWQDGFDVVYAQRIAREGETALKRLTARYFYQIINSIGGVEIPKDTGDFRLLSRRAVESLKQLNEQHRFMKGLFAWIGYPQKAVRYHRDARFAGRTKWNYWKLWNFAIEGITSFTIAPLKIATYIGLVTAGFAISYGLFIISKTLIYGNPVAGYPSLIVVILFLGGAQLITLGVMGEYLGRMFNEVKQRPLYLINQYLPARRLTKEMP